MSRDRDQPGLASDRVRSGAGSVIAWQSCSAPRQGGMGGAGAEASHAMRRATGVPGAEVAAGDYVPARWPPPTPGIRAGYSTQRPSATRGKVLHEPRGFCAPIR